MQSSPRRWTGLSSSEQIRDSLHAGGLINATSLLPYLTQAVIEVSNSNLYLAFKVEDELL
ncbi:hypothetical protein ABN584_23315 [Gloeocapsa sp. BRSZ]